MCVCACVVFALRVVCSSVQVFKGEITESGWVRPTDVSSGEPVWLRQGPQLSSLSLSACLWPRSEAPVTVSSHSRSPFPRQSLSPRSAPLFCLSVPSFYAFRPLLCPGFLSFLILILRLSFLFFFFFDAVFLCCSSFLCCSLSELWMGSFETWSVPVEHKPTES